MVVSTSVVARRYEDVAAGTPISVDIPAYEAGDVYVYYGNASLVAVQGTDYTVALAGDFETFTVTPTASLVAKIEALIAADATEENYITVRRTLDYETESTPAGVRYTPFTSKEFDRNAMRDMQLAEATNRALRLPPSEVGATDTALTYVGNGQVIKKRDDGTGFVGADLVIELSETQAWFASRNTASAAAAAALANGTIVVVGGLLYQVDDAATGSASATNDLGVDGLVPFGDATFEHYGATGGVDDLVAMSAALANGGRVRGKAGRTYSFSGTLNIVSGTVLDLRGCSLVPTSAVVGAAVRAYQQSGITVHWGAAVGTGAAFSTGDENLVVFEECDRVRSYGGLFHKSRNMGILLKDCDNCMVHSPISLNCYGTGFQDRDGKNNTWINPISDGNGDTGVATYSGGRGLLVWRGTNITVFGGSSSRCSEYGLRVYSATGDAIGSAQVKVVGHHCEDNDVIDFYVYNEGGDVGLIEFDNCTVRRSTDPSAHPVVLQGSNVTWRGGSVKKDGVRAGVASFLLYGLSDSKVVGVHFRNQGQMIAWSASALCSDVLISDNVADIVTCGAPLGTGIEYRGNRFTHGGAGATDIAIDCGASTEIVCDSNKFDGFYRNVSWTAQAITLRNNTSRNTTDVSLRMNGDGVAGLVSSGNDWDTGSNPSWVASAYRQKNSNSRIEIFADSVPSGYTFARGDVIKTLNPVAGGPTGRRCVAGGTPGTWYSEGGIQGSNAFAVTNVTTDRSFDANATTVDEIADVLGTLIADLKASGVVS